MVRKDLKPEPMRLLRLPHLYWGCSLQEIPDKCKHKDFLQRYIINIQERVGEGVGLLLWGEYSTGKSAAASIILKVGASWGIVGLWIKAGDVPGYVIQGNLFNADMSLIDRARSVSLLVLDELIMYGDNRDAFVESLIRDRINEQKVTIITTNHTPTEILEKSPALGEVLREGVIPLRVMGHNFREDLASRIREGVFG